jgi:hypothetical protein
MENLIEYKTDNLYICTFVVPIYETKVCFLKYKDSEGYLEALKYLEELAVKIEDYKTNEYMLAYGFVINDRSKHGLMKFMFINGSEEYKTEIVNTLAHENFHLIEHIIRQCGLENIEDGDNEHIAYLTGYLYNKITELNRNL